jgi:ketosteroid isomerase-like protein
MKARVALLLLIILLPCVEGARASEPPVPHTCKSTDESDIRHIAELWKEGYNSGNAEQVASLYDENAFYLTQHYVKGIMQGRASIRAYVQRGVDAGFKIDSIDVVASECSGNLAYTVGSYHSTNAGQKAFGVNLVVLKKTENTWRIVAHESAVPDPATAIQGLGTETQ